MQVLGTNEIGGLDACRSIALDCKTVRIFAYSSTREQPNKRSGARLKMESETGERLLTSLPACGARAFPTCETLLLR